MNSEFVIYQGVRVAKGWPEKIDAAQLNPTAMIVGQELQRVRCGDLACGDCGVVDGQIHVLGCDLERCPACGGQKITCECNEPRNKL